MNSLKIEPIREEDVPACTEIYNYYIQNTCYTLEEEPLLPEAFAARVRTVSAKYPYLVAKNEEGRVLGYAYLSTFNERSAYRRTADLSIYTDHTCRRAGVGSALLAAIEEAATAAGLEHIVSLVTTENEGSVAFHLRHGFRKAGELTDVAVKFGRYCGVSFFLKALHA